MSGSFFCYLYYKVVIRKYIYEIIVSYIILLTMTRLLFISLLIISNGIFSQKVESIKYPLIIQTNPLRALMHETNIEIIFPRNKIQPKLIFGMAYNIPMFSKNIWCITGGVDILHYRGFLIGGGMRLNSKKN
ncbi:MAG: hypothetical protein ACI8Q1_003294 [Parvicella sp.]